MSQLGWFPTDAGFDAVEVSRHTTDDAPRMAEFRGFGLAITGSSDSHYLNDIGRTSTLLTCTSHLRRAGPGGLRADGRGRAVHDLSLYLLELLETPFEPKQKIRLSIFSSTALPTGCA